MKLNRTPIAAALCCMALASASAWAAGYTSTTPSASMQRGDMSGASMSTDTVRQVQQALADKGFSPGPVDGIVGPRTRAALSKYQRSQNLTGASGMDQRTMDSLGVHASASGMGSGTTSGSMAGGTSSGTSGSAAGSAGASGSTTGGSGGSATGSSSAGSGSSSSPSSPARGATDGSGSGK
ncbi:MAG: peptidoglycan-binding protein [Burkholderiales bacterium]|nr:peptidoglycan-binding protein [Burkholderiales bacterium]